MEYDKGTAILKKHYKSIESLRDVSMDQLKQHEAEFDQAIYKRSKFVVEENSRVLDCCEMLKQGDMTGFGLNMYRSQEGLVENSEESRTELDFLIKKVKSSGLTIGSRRMTSGFGGSAISLVKIENVDPFIKYAQDVYNAEFGLPLKIYPLKIENGTAKL